MGGLLGSLWTRTGCAAGDAGVGRLRRHARALQHGAGPRQGEELGARPTRRALDPGPRQPLPLRASPRTGRRGDGAGRRRAHRRAREEVPRPGQVPVPPPGRGAHHVQGGARARAGDVRLASRPRGAVEERPMAEPAVATAGRRWVFEGREVTMPVVVRDAASAAATYLVPSAAARRLLPGPELDVVELLPGRALFSIAAIDYRDNDLGDYNEVSLALFVRPPGQRGGVLHRTPFVAGATGVGIHLGGAELVLGDHPVAAELRSLGLPKGALMSVWMEHSHGRFEAPAPC